MSQCRPVRTRATQRINNMNAPQSRTVVNPSIAVSDSLPPAESTIKALSRPEREKLSSIGRRYGAEEHALSSYSTGDWITDWGGTGGFWDAVWSLLTGPAVSVVPQVAPIDRTTAQVAQTQKAPDMPGIQPGRDGQLTVDVATPCGGPLISKGFRLRWRAGSRLRAR